MKIKAEVLKFEDTGNKKLVIVKVLKDGSGASEEQMVLRTTKIFDLRVGDIVVVDGIPITLDGKPSLHQWSVKVIKRGNGIHMSSLKKPRVELEEYLDKEVVITGQVWKIGTDKATGGTTVLLLNVEFQGIKYDHLWLKGKIDLSLLKKTVEVKGKVMKYSRSDGSEDYTLSDWTVVKII